MERKQKTYQSTQYVQLDTYVLVNGSKFPVEFRGGTLEPRRNGTFTTTDPDVIKQLDDDIKRVGESRSAYKCIHEEVLLEDKKTDEIPIDEKTVPDIKTVTAAKEWLLSASETGIIRKGITPSMIKNRTDVLKLAAENKVTFTDLPKEG